jgi:hypothetical protein
MPNYEAGKGPCGFESRFHVVVLLYRHEPLGEWEKAVEEQFPTEPGPFFRVSVNVDWPEGHEATVDYFERCIKEIK